MKQELIIAKAASIMNIAMEMNATPTKKEVTGNKPTVFIDFSGHVSQLTIRIYSSGWTRDTSPDRKYEIYIDEDCSVVFYRDKKSQMLDTEFLINEAYYDLLGLKMRYEYEDVLLEEVSNVNV